MIDHALLMKEAYQAASNSKDRSTQNGALLVNSRGEVLAAAWNDIPNIVKDRDERRERPLKYDWTEHAERAVLYKACRRGIETDGLTMYCPWLACADCGRAIVLSWIRRVVRHKIPQHADRPDWLASIAVADQMFKEAGVEVVEIEDKLDVTFRFNGEMIEV